MPEQMPSVDGDDFVAYMLDAGFLLLQVGMDMELYNNILKN